MTAIDPTMTTTSRVQPHLRRRGWFLTGLSWPWSLLGIVLFLALWELLSRTGVINERFYSSPWGWGHALWHLIGTGSLWSNLWATLKIVLYGLLISIGVGVPLGIAIGCFQKLDWMTRPLVAAFQAVPYVAVLPIIILSFGIDEKAKVVVALWSTLFPLIFTATDGVHNISDRLLRVPRAFCISRTRTILTVVVPASLPYVLSGIRVAIGRALVGAIVAEFFMANEGIGYYVSQQANSFNTDNAFAGLVIMAVLGILLVRGVGVIESRYARWKA
jgi:ABC-type nitrate/sulfonate/bicarbonate transport system permease component